MPTAPIHNNDVLKWAASYDGPPFHALLCDPPYELGFMGRDWDRSGIAFDPDTWAALAKHLLPGAFGMAFASARGWHRLAVAIEDAGLVIHPSIFGWAYGSGFPKATRIDTQVNAAAGVEREVVLAKWAGRRTEGSGPENGDSCYGQFGIGDTMTAPVTDLARTWEGHRYGLQAIKPALEPIIVFQKPYQGRPIDSITEHGAGALWIDGGRVGTESTIVSRNGRSAEMGYQGGGERPSITGSGAGRWPANLVLCHHPDCVRVGMRRVKGITGGEGETTQSIGGRGAYQGGDNRGFFHYVDAEGLETVEEWDCVPECPVRRLGEQSGERSSGSGDKHDKTQDGNLFKGFKPMPGRPSTGGDNGTAARFFYNADWSYEVAEQLATADPVRYCAKASRRERDAGLEGFEAGPPRADSLTAGIERKNAKMRSERKSKNLMRNPHPTIKPISLAKWLATLLLPPGEYAPRRLLVPFAGVGSEIIGAQLAGWEEIEGVEREPEYCEIGAARLAWWREQAQWGQNNPSILLQATIPGQPSLFQPEPPNDPNTKKAPAHPGQGIPNT